MKALILLVILLPVIAVVPGRTQSVLSPGIRFLDRVNDTSDVRPTDYKSKVAAIARSLGHTLVPITFSVVLAKSMDPGWDDDGAWFFISSFALYGTIFGPSMGNFYAGDGIRGWGGVLARTGGLIMILNTIDDDNAKTIGTYLLIGSAVYNIASGPASVEKYNRKINQQPMVQVMPALDIQSKAPLLSLRINL